MAHRKLSGLLQIAAKRCVTLQSNAKESRNSQNSNLCIFVMLQKPLVVAGNDFNITTTELKSEDGGHRFDPYLPHHPVLPKPQIPAPPPSRPFLWGFSLVSFGSFRLWRHFAVSQPDFSLASLHTKIPFPASGFSTARSRSAAGNFWGMEAKNDVSNPVHNYCGFNPRASNCWLHSAGASRSRSTPIPRGKRPSTAARTRSGARNASEIVMLT